jgi:ribose-phosphate pyrophosphokinase
MRVPKLLLNLTLGITETKQYKAWKFPGGEIHVKLSEEFMHSLTLASKREPITIFTRINSSDDFIFLLIVADTLYKTWENPIHVYMPYMPYQQADRDFGEGECFSLQTICNILRNTPIATFTIFDAHSDVTPGLLGTCEVIDNSKFIEASFEMMAAKNGPHWTPNKNLVVLSPDAGAYKKIFKLMEKIKFKGEIENANKYRDTTDGSLKIRLSREDFGGKDILIIDDICIGGRTFIDLAAALENRNVGSKYLAVSHGIFSNGLIELSKRFKDIFTTNSRRADYEELIKEVQMLSNQMGVGTQFQLHAFEVI